MSDYAIFPTEAILLGECLGEYVELVTEFDATNQTFLDLVRRRLARLIPSLAEHKSFVGLSELAEKPRKSLPEILVLKLQGALALSEFDNLIGLDPSSDIFRRWMDLNELHAIRSGNDDVAKNLRNVVRHTGKDDHTTIVSTLNKLASESGHSVEFDTGRRFGEIIAGCDRAVADLSNPEDTLILPAEMTMKDWYVSEGKLKELANSPLVKNNGIMCRRLEDAEVEISTPFYLGDGEADNESAFNHACDLLATVSCAFGEVLGLIREIDTFASDSNAKSPIPREYQYVLPSNATIDQVRVAIEDAHRLLTDKSPSVRPESIFRMLLPAIEALTKRIWPGVRSYQSWLPQHLKGKRYSHNRLEARFADTAYMLYLHYRNTGTHEMDSFRCSFTEAHFFVSGIRCLLEITESLLKHPKP